MNNKDSKYQQYVTDCKRENIAIMSHKEWARYDGGKTLAELRVHWFGEAKAEQISAKSKAPKGPKKVLVNATGPSTDIPSRGSTRRVWEIADSLVANGISAPRADIIDACIKDGVNRGTAATQYSAWVKARREGK